MAIVSIDVSPLQVVHLPVTIDRLLHEIPAVAFAYIENILRSSPADLNTEIASTLSLLAEGKKHVVNAGTQEIVVDDAYEEFEALIKNITTPDAQGRKTTEKRLLEIFQARPSGNSFAIDDGTPLHLSAKGYAHAMHE